jgi:hypothetical protein
VDGLRVIRTGLQGDETVIVEGAAKVRPNSKVNASATDMNKYATGQLAMETHIDTGPDSKTLRSRDLPVSGAGGPGRKNSLSGLNYPENGSPLTEAKGGTKPAR